MKNRSINNQRMKHSATCDAVSSVSYKTPSPHSPSVGNLTTPQKTPYDLLLEQIQQRHDWTVPTTNYGVSNGLDNPTNIGRYKLHEILGKGSFSKVQLATHQLTKGLFVFCLR